jgi:hypothetical protein
MAWLGVDPLFDDIREHPRFRSVLAQRREPP